MSHCFIHGDLSSSDIDLFFGPLDGSETICWFSPDSSLGILLVRAGIFPSVKQATKNGWNRELAPGFQSVKVGKKMIFILNDWPGHNSNSCDTCGRIESDMCHDCTFDGLVDGDD